MAMESLDFIKSVFLFATGPVFLTALPSAREIATRKPGDIERFVQRNDIPGQDGVYFCPSALAPDVTLSPGERSLRSKRTAALAGAAWMDLDAKDILISLEDAATVFRGLRYPPSYLVWSGNGLHPYWLLSEAFDVQADQEAFESLLRRLAECFGGDLAPAHAAPLMRLPGTHNRKRGEAKLVTIEGDGRRYHFEDLEEWLDEQPVTIERKVPLVAEAETNPFLIAAREHGWKPTLDVEGELSRMVVGNIHHTCVRVSASLLMRGVSADDVVARLLGEIERVKLAAGQRFQARREERKLAGMCRTWMAKHPVEARRKEERVMDERPGEVHTLDGARAKKKAKAETETGDKSSLHIAIAEGVLAAMRERGEAVLFTPKTMCHCRDGLWSMMPREEGKGILDPLIEEGCEALNIKSSNRLASEARGWISRQPSLNQRVLEFDRHCKIPTWSGLIDPETFACTPIRQDSFCTWRVETTFDPAAECPWWLQMLNDAFADRNEHERTENIRVIQEIAGCALIDAKPREMTKGLIIQGGPNTGKTGIVEVLSGLFGSDPITSKLDSIDTSHGLMPFVRRAPWALHEAFEQSKWHFSANVKTIITGEPFSVNIKNGPIITIRYRGPLFWATNYPPQFKEATRAVIERFIMVEMRRVFEPREPRIGAALEAARKGYSSPAELVLATEMPGVLNWALQGYKDARLVGRITLTDEAMISREEINRDSNLVAGFIEDCVDFDPGMMVTVQDFYTAFCAWWSEEKGSRNIPERKQVGKAISALGDARVAVNDKELRTNAERFYAGIILNDRGIDFHKQALTIPSLNERTGSATRDGLINRDIPGSWNSKPSVRRLRAIRP